MVEAIPTSRDGTTTTTSTTVSAEVTPETTSAPGNAEPVALAEWQRIELIDADGEAFTFDDLVGRPVFVETFATWCGNCRRQLGDTNQAAEKAGDDAVFVALSVETDLDPGDMADYADEQGFDHVRFAVMSPEMLAAVNDAFGNTASEPAQHPARDGRPRRNRRRAGHRLRLARVDPVRARALTPRARAAVDRRP